MYKSERIEVRYRFTWVTLARIKACVPCMRSLCPSTRLSKVRRLTNLGKAQAAAASTDQVWCPTATGQPLSTTACLQVPRFKGSTAVATQYEVQLLGGSNCGEIGARGLRWLENRGDGRCSSRYPKDWHVTEGEGEAEEQAQQLTCLDS